MTRDLCPLTRFRRPLALFTSPRYYSPHNNVTSVCIFIGCWPWSIRGPTHRWREIHVRSRQLTFLSFFMPPKSHKIFNKPYEFLSYKTNRSHFSLCMYCNRSQKTSQCVKNNSHATQLRLVSYFLFFYTLWRLLWSITVHTHTEKCYLFVKKRKTPSWHYHCRVITTFSLDACYTC